MVAKDNTSTCIVILLIVNVGVPEPALSKPAEPAIIVGPTKVGKTRESETVQTVASAKASSITIVETKPVSIIEGSIEPKKPSKLSMQ